MGSICRKRIYALEEGQWRVFLVSENAVIQTEHKNQANINKTQNAELFYDNVFKNRVVKWTPVK